MHKTKDQLYDLIKDLKTNKEFEEEIKKRFQEYDELLDKNVIALFIVDELGRNKQVIDKIADIKPNTDCTVVGKITNIYQAKDFKRKNGSAGKVVNLDISDETGSCRLVLWNEDVKKAEHLKEGSTVKIINGYTKNGFSGLEINLGRWGLLEIEPEDASHLNNLKSDNDKRDIVGILIRKEPTRAFFKVNGEFGFVTTIKIKDENEEKQLTLWSEKVKEIQQFKIGEKIIISGVDNRQNNGKIEIHVNGKSTIRRC